MVTILNNLAHGVYFGACGIASNMGWSFEIINTLGVSDEGGIVPDQNLIMVD